MFYRLNLSLVLKFCFSYIQLKDLFNEITFNKSAKAMKNDSKLFENAI